MAKTKIVLAFFLIVLILCQELVDVEGRHLRSKPCKKCSKHHGKSTLSAKEDGGRANASSGQEKASKMEHLDDFRPTSPGHSPGIGHSIQN